MDGSLIHNISWKGFLSDIKTKSELMEYLAAKCLDYSNSSSNRLKKFIVTSRTESHGNIDAQSTLITHCQEKADNLLLLHTLTVARDAEVVVDSPDTDVFLES